MRAAIGALALLLVASPALSQRVSNPELYGKSLEAAAQALKYYGAYDDPEELDRIARIGYRIVEASSYRRFPFTFHLLDMPAPNALALPGGQIFVTRGMLDLGLSDDMLAGLLGHEIAHVAREHGLKMERRATLLNALSTALLVGVIVAAGGNDDRPVVPEDPFGRDTQRRGGGNVVEGTMAASLVVGELLLRSYSREFEDEADEEGQRWAAAAGFDPDGTRRLHDALRARIPEAREYGYWRTHPFFEQRVTAAAARAKYLKAQEEKPADDLRAATQEELLAYLREHGLPGRARGPAGQGRRPDGTGRSPDAGRDQREGAPGPEADPAGLLEAAALVAWPQGPRADDLRRARLHALRDTELAEPEARRDWGRVITAYREEVAAVQELTPESPLLPALRRELGDLQMQAKTFYPQAVEIFRGGVYETEFLETFLSNYPDAPEAAEAALALGDAYSRTGREADAVARYLEAWQQAPGGPAAAPAREGLRRLAPGLDRLAALQQLSAQEEDPELARLADERLLHLASTYNEMANGADYLKRYPDGEYVQLVTTRLDNLADKLYGELVLYQAVGDHIKALERIQKILTHAPLSPAADRLRERAILKS